MNIIIGRNEDCDITIKDEYASPRHCEVSNESGRWLIRDLGSTNGTWLNWPSVKVPLGSWRALLLGDRIRVGRTDLPPWDRP